MKSRLDARLRMLALLLLPVPGLSAQVDWSRVTTPTKPPALTDHVLAYDDIFLRALLFGGDDGTGPTNSLWMYDPSSVSWSRRSTLTSPPARLRHAGAFDHSRKTFVIFGGRDKVGLRNDTWEFISGNWTLITPPTSPTARDDHAMCYDSNSKRILLFGGRTAAGAANDTWAWDGQNWTQITTRTSPTPRWDHGMVFDRSRGVAVTHGGYFASGVTVRTDTWEFDGNDWARRTPSVSPGARAGYGFVYDPYRQRTVLSSGYAAPGYPQDTWEWDGNTWTQRVPRTKPPGLSGHAMCYSTENLQVIQFGGQNPARNSETWFYGTTEPATVENGGQACQGRIGSELLGVDDSRYPWVGATLGIEVMQVPSGAPVAIFLGFSRNAWGNFTLPLSLDAIGATGCRLFTSPDLVTAATTIGSSAKWDLPIPNIANLSSKQFFLQGLVIAPNVNAFGAVFTNLGVVTIGRR